MNISGNFNCNSFNVIYAISCNLCPKLIYIGEIRNLIKQPINGHRGDIKNNKNKPVAEHVDKLDHTLENIRLVVVKKSKV